MTEYCLHVLLSDIIIMGVFNINLQVIDYNAISAYSHDYRN